MRAPSGATRGTTSSTMAGNSSIATASCSADRRAVRKEKEEEKEEEDRVWGFWMGSNFQASSPRNCQVNYVSVSSTDLAARYR